MNEIIKGTTIKFLHSDETFIIDKVLDNNFVDLIATKEYRPDLDLHFHEKLYSIKIINFEVVQTKKNRDREQKLKRILEIT